MKFLFFDTETNGLPLAYGKSYTEVDNWPRVIQLAWILADIDRQIIRRNAALIRPDGWTVPKEEFWIKNGHSTERCEAEGAPIEDVIIGFMEAKEEADVLVAHNLGFDHPIVWAEIIRTGRQPISGKLKVCTMRSSTKYCNIQGKRGPKWPKLEELYLVLFGKPFEGAHDANADITATMDSFFELVRRGVINLAELTNTKSHA